MHHRVIQSARFAAFLAAAGLSVLGLPAWAAGPPDPASLMSEQRQALQALAIFDGTWRGPAKVTLPDGKQLDLTQTERVGPFLGGAVRFIEGRGHMANGNVGFNAFAVISYAPESGNYNFRSYAQGHAGDFPLQLRPDGFVWSIQAGPAVLRYTATVKDGVWTEVGERLVAGQPPVQIFEMTLQRVGGTDWPAGGAVGPKP